MGTFTAMQTALAAELSDPSNLTFDTTALAAFINAGVIEVGRICPTRFQVDITPIADTLVYVVSTGEPEIEVRQVELWDASTTPDSYVMLVPPVSGEYTKASAVGWMVWNGSLYIPNSLEAILLPAKHLLRVWGYGPYAIVTGSTEMPMSTELEYAVRAYAKVQAIENLVMKRNLFTQWQAAPENTDISEAALMQQLTMARADWERRAQKIMLLREAS